MRLFSLACRFVRKAHVAKKFVQTDEEDLLEPSFLGFGVPYSQSLAYPCANAYDYADALSTVLVGLPHFLNSFHGWVVHAKAAIDVLAAFDNSIFGIRWCLALFYVGEEKRSRPWLSSLARFEIHCSYSFMLLPTGKRYASSSNQTCARITGGQ